MKIVCLGDSLTRGYGVAKEDTWVERAARRLNAQLLNRGVTGDTSGGMLARFGREVLDQRPAVAFLMGGGNDLRAGCVPAVPQANLMAMLHQAQAHGIFPVVGLSPPPDLPNLAPRWAAFRGNYVDEGLRQAYREWLAEYCRAFSIPTVDFHADFTAAFRREERAAFYSDGLHPNEKGQALMADTFCRRMLEITAGWPEPVLLRDGTAA